MVLNLFYDSVDFRYPPLFFFFTIYWSFDSHARVFQHCSYRSFLLWSRLWRCSAILWVNLYPSLDSHRCSRLSSHPFHPFFLIWKVCSADKELWPLSYLRYFLLLKHIHFHYCWALILCYNIASIYYSQLSLALYFVGSSLIVSRARPVQTDCRLTNLRESYGCSITDLTMDIFQTGSLCL